MQNIRQKKKSGNATGVNYCGTCFFIRKTYSNCYNTTCLYSFTKGNPVSHRFLARLLVISESRSWIAIRCWHHPPSWEACHIESCSALLCCNTKANWNVSHNRQAQTWYKQDCSLATQMLRPERKKTEITTKKVECMLRVGMWLVFTRLIFFHNIISPVDMHLIVLSTICSLLSRPKENSCVFLMLNISVRYLFPQYIFSHLCVFITSISMEVSF